MRTRPADPVFARRLGQRLHTWDVDQDTFLAQVESVVLAALLATADEPAASLPGTWCPAAAAVLRRQQDVQMFAALPAALPDLVKGRMHQLRLMSTGLTSCSGRRWLRLCDTACEFLAPAALLENGGEPPLSQD
ncbi:hypothetical protein [Streptomyces djakartensis]|uniref:Uncharacterized protein n=1 Tax=Streptomyces djakartensis TaxID=68193 RepID=A0ABQ3A569_9ACTN|nr:hypothetical protein [Streptomyces djakartensis]GGY34840.1 hypothetical protein GCM10010384_47350 [Streptomyces djakartensis]